MASNKLQQYEQETQVVTIGDATIEQLQAENALLRMKLAQARHQINLLIGNREFQVLNYLELEQAMRRIGESHPAYDVIYLAVDQAEMRCLQQKLSFAGLQRQIHTALNCLHATDPIGQTHDAFIAIVPARHAEMLKYRLVDRLGQIGIQVYAASGQCISPDLGLCLKPLIKKIDDRLRGAVDLHAAPVAKLGRGAVVRGVSVE